MGAWELELVGESDGERLIFDSVVHPEYDELSRVHVDAVLGDVISPLAWTLVGPAFEHSQWWLWQGLGAMRRREDDCYRFAIRSGGRLHINVSTLRELAARMVSASPADVDHELGLSPDVPRGVTWADRRWYVRTIPWSSWFFATLAVRLRNQRRVVSRAVASGRDLTELSTPALVARIEQLRRRELASVLLPHHGIRMLTKVALDRLHELCGDSDLANGLMADLPNLEATEPSRALVRVAMTCRQRGTLDADALDDFIDRFGHRGVNELDPTAPVWANQRQHLVDVVTRMSAASIDESATTMGSQVRTAAEAALRERPRLQRARVAPSLRLARRLAVGGERSKGAVARYVHELRRALDELRTRLPDTVADDDVVLLSWVELQALVVAGTSAEVDVDIRRRELSAVRSAATDLRPSSGETIVLHGIGASMGTATGQAAVVHDPLAPLPEGQILVAHTTDTAWTPLFLGMRAVVTDTGQLMSHSSIVARDLGIPAVVGTGTATSRIATGDHTDVDGTRGIVTVRTTFSATNRR